MTAPRTRARPSKNTSTSKTTVAREDVAKGSDVKTKGVGSVEVVGAEGTVLIARVRFTDGVTLNMGDYSSFRRDIGLEVDVPLGESNGMTLTEAQQQAIDKAYDTAKTWVEDRIYDSVEDAKDFFEGIDG